MSTWTFYCHCIKKFATIIIEITQFLSNNLETLWILSWKKNNNDHRNTQIFLNISNLDKINEINLIVKTKIDINDIIWNFKQKFKKIITIIVTHKFIWICLILMKSTKLIWSWKQKFNVDYITRNFKKKCNLFTQFVTRQNH